MVESRRRLGGPSDTTRRSDGKKGWLSSVQAAALADAGAVRKDSGSLFCPVGTRMMDVITSAGNQWRLGGY